MSPLPTIVNNYNLSSMFHKTMSMTRKKELHTDIQTFRNKRLAKRCRGRLHGSAWGRACLDIDASQEPRCRPTPLCRASGRTSSDSTSRNSTTLILNDQLYIINAQLRNPKRLSTSSDTTHYIIVNVLPSHSARSTTTS